MSNGKLLHIKTKFSSSQMALVGFCIWPLYLKRDCLTAVIPSSLGIFVYRFVTSRVHNMMSSVNLTSSNKFRKCLLSLM